MKGCDVRGGLRRDIAWSSPAGASTGTCNASPQLSRLIDEPIGEVVFFFGRQGTAMVSMTTAVCIASSFDMEGNTDGRAVVHEGAFTGAY